ncbi:MAG: DHH family phosphoesterase [Desulfomonilia bacterium]|nr:DHH family phosphoesterase [Desulfomonilia bacterium]
MKAKIIDLIKQHTSFEIITHEGPDEDAVGSSRALAFGLLSLGKVVRIIYPSPIPDSLQFTPAPKEHRVGSPDVSLLLDVSDMSMIAGVTPRGTIVVIDHHKTNDGFGDLYWIAPEKSSTSEMIYELCTDLNIDISSAMATNLYLGLFGDTGGFVHANTTPEVFNLASVLARAGADPNAIANKLKKTRSLIFFHLLCSVMDRLFFQEGICAGYIEFSDMLSAHARPEDTSGIIDEMASLAGAELVILLKELDPDTVHGSLRSRTGEAALNTARAFGGGGHAMAAGFTLRGSARDLVLDVIEEGGRWIEKG